MFNQIPGDLAVSLQFIIGTLIVSTFSILGEIIFSSLPALFLAFVANFCNADVTQSVNLGLVCFLLEIKSKLCLNMFSENILGTKRKLTLQCPSILTEWYRRTSQQAWYPGLELPPLMSNLRKVFWKNFLETC